MNWPADEGEGQFFGWQYVVERKTNPKEIVCGVANKEGVVIKTIIQSGQWDEEKFLLHVDYLALDASGPHFLLATEQ